MPKHNPLMQFKAINKPDPKEITDEAIKKLVIDTLGTDGTVKLTPETLDSNLSLRELGATSDNMRALLRALDDKYKLGNSEARRSPASYSPVESLESALEPFFDNYFLSQDGGIDIDTVGKIKKILLTGRATETKNWWNKYPSYADMVRKLDPTVSPHGHGYLDLDEYEGFPMPNTDEERERYWLGLSIYTDKEKDQQALQLVDKLFEKRWLKSDKSVLNQYLKSKGLVTDEDKQDMLFRAIFKLHENEDYVFDDEFKNKEKLLTNTIFKLPMNKKSMPYFIDYVDKLPTLPFLKAAASSDMYELPIRNKIDKKKVTDENIKRIILQALGDKGALKLKPEDLQGDTSLMELGARRKNIWDLGKLLDKEFKPDGVDYDYDPYEKEGTPYPYFQQSGIDIDSVNKIKKALLSKSNFVPKGYDDYYDSKYPTYETVALEIAEKHPVLSTFTSTDYTTDYDEDPVYQDVYVPEEAIANPEIPQLFKLLLNKKYEKLKSLLEEYIKNKLMDDAQANNMLGALSLIPSSEFHNHTFSPAAVKLLYDRLKKNNKQINSLNIVNLIYQPSFVNDEEWEDVSRGLGDNYQ